VHLFCHNELPTALALLSSLPLVGQAVRIKWAAFKSTWAARRAASKNG
jgi:hypothetical protein